MSPEATSASLPWLLAALMLLCTAGGVLALYISRKGERRALALRFVELVRDETPTPERTGWVERFARTHLHAEGESSLAHEDARLLAQIGWRRRELHAAFPLMRVLLAVLAAMGAAAYASLDTANLPLGTLLLRGFIGGASGYLLPKYVLRMLAHSRVRRIDLEVSPFAQILCVLFDAGLSFEQSLRVILRDGEVIVRELRLELELVLRQIASGADRSDAFSLVMGDLGVPDLSDLAKLLSQIERHGGGARESLREFCGLLDDRRRTGVQERVSKLSAKMTMVMIGFLFPALLIFIGGPGFIALKQALEGAGR